jgi:DNA cross-link repair 1A protein
MDAVYLDTTYLDAKYCFPAQELVVSACAQLVRERVLDGDEDALGRTGGEEQVRQVGMMKGWLKEGKAKKEEEDAEAERLLLEMEMGEGAEGVESAIKYEEKPDVKPRKKEKLLVLVGTYSIGKER